MSQTCILRSPTPAKKDQCSSLELLLDQIYYAELDESLTFDILIAVLETV